MKEILVNDNTIYYEGYEIEIVSYPETGLFFRVDGFGARGNCETLEKAFELIDN